MPTTVAPMLCTLTQTPIDDLEYLYEIKWDGYRIVSYVERKKVRMDSRSGLDYTARYPVIVKALQNLGHDVVLDGEVVIFNEKGIPDFDAVQLYNGDMTDITYCLFDIVWMDGYNLMELPLETRKTILQQLVDAKPFFLYSESFDDGPALYKEVQERNIEGMVAKRRDSIYVPGERGNNWLKTPVKKRQEFVVGGWSVSDKTQTFSSLQLGAYVKGELKWKGRTGSGFREAEKAGILKKLKGLEISESPFVNKVLDTKGAKMHWIKPQIVVIVELSGYTKSGRFRKPATFVGFRYDKKPKDVILEVPKPVKVIEEEVHKEPPAPNEKPRNKLKTMPASNWPIVEGIPIRNRTVLDFPGCSIEVTNKDKVIWPEVKNKRDAITKEELIFYYHNVAPFILPYLHDRPQSLHIRPWKATDDRFFIKDMEGRQPDCAVLFTDKRRHAHEGKRQIIDYLVCNNEAVLLFMIEKGCVDINPWNCRRMTPEQPDWLVIDLDPTVKKDKAGYIDKLRDAAIATKEWCNRHKIKAFPKTSGQTGIHFYIPCMDIDTLRARAIADHICQEIHDLAPESTTNENQKNRRGNLVYVDPSQNDYADTLAAPYSVRPFFIPTVSTPLEWKKINHRLDPHVFTIDNILDRIKKKGDLFSGVLDTKIAAANMNMIQKL